MLNARSSSSWRLYVIVDAAAAGGRDLAWVARQAIQGGADLLQLRDKTAPASRLIRQAQALLAVTRPAGIPLIINDRADVAAAVGADGVHLGQDDVPVSAARRLLGPEAIIGQSTHSLDQALAADRGPITYLALGPIFATPTKPDYGSVGIDLLRAVALQIRHPLVAIGGIEDQRLRDVTEAGARCVAVVRAVCGASDPAQAARRLKSRLTQFVRSSAPA